MTHLQKTWVRIIGLMVLAAFAINWGFNKFSTPHHAAHISAGSTLNGSSADLFCESFFSTIIREQAQDRIGLDHDEVKRLRSGFQARSNATVDTENLTDAEREALYAGRLRTVSRIASLERDDERDTALATLTTWYTGCDTRLTKQGVPAPPAGPEPGSTEWYVQNR